MTEENEVADAVEDVEDEPEIESQTDDTEKTVTKETKKPAIRNEESAVKELRKENEKLRKSLETQAKAQGEAMAKEQAKLIRADAKAAAQKLIDEKVAEIENRARTQTTKSELRVHAERAGVVDFGDLYEIMKTKDLAKVEYDDEGNVANAAELITELKKSKPHFFGGVSTSSTEKVPPASKVKEPEKIALNLNGDDYRRARQALNSL